MLIDEILDAGFKDHGDQLGGDPQCQGLILPVLEAVQIDLQLLFQRQHRTHVLQIDRAGLRQSDRGGVPVQQPYPQIVLQTGEILGEGGLRDV